MAAGGFQIVPNTLLVQTQVGMITDAGTAGAQVLSAETASAIRTIVIEAGSITEAALDVANSPTDAYVLSYQASSGQMLWVAQAGGSFDGAFSSLSGIPTTLAGYGITDAATSAQGALADSAVQPADNVSSLTNDAGYITGYTVTEGDVTAHQAALAITESQISDLSHDAVSLQSVSLDASVATPSDGDILVYRSAGTDWVLEAKPASGGIGGSTGATDNRILRADGVGGSTLQASSVTIDDSGNLSLPAGMALQNNAASSESLWWQSSITLSAKARGAANTAAYDFQILSTTAFSILRDSGTGVDGVCLGPRTATSPTTGRVYATSGSGTDIAGADLNLNAGRPTGSGTGGSLRLRTAPSGASGTTLGTLTDRIVITSAGQIQLKSDVTAENAAAKTTPVDADTVGLFDSSASNVLKKLSWTNIKATLKTYFDTLYRPKSDPYYIEVALSTNGEAIASGTFKGFARVHTAGTITGFVVDCDPNNEPSTVAVEVDLNTVNRSTGAATSVLSAVASIATSANTATGTVSGSPSVSSGDLLSFDIDQGSDGKDLIATVEITPS